MPRILSAERVIEYTVEFKTKVVQLTYELDVQTTAIAKVLKLHPMMIYRWRQEYREDKFVETRVLRSVTFVTKSLYQMGQTNIGWRCNLS